MNRREFLQTLVAIGASFSIPGEALARVPDPEIDTVWSEALATPRVFYVNRWGALSDRPGSEGFDFTQDRRDLFRLGATPSSGQALINFIESISPLDDHAWQTHRDLFDDYWRDNAGHDCPWATWQDWALSVDCDDLVVAVNDWLDDLPDDTDYQVADTAGLSCRGDALFFFSRQQEVAQLLGVDCADVKRCWHVQHAAVLTIDCDVANSIAQARGLPVCFEAWEDNDALA